MIILREESNSLISLSPIYDWFKEKGFKFEKEHILIEGIPVQFIPVYNDLVKEAVENSLENKYESTNTKVISSEYLVAIMLDTFRPKDKERIIKFVNEADLNYEVLNKILHKYNLTDKFKSLSK